MNTYYLTFGQQYRDEPHPSGNEIHPDGWVEIKAKTYDDARRQAFATFGVYWCWLYGNEFEPESFPLGCLMTIEAQHDTNTET